MTTTGDDDQRDTAAGQSRTLAKVLGSRYEVLGKLGAGAFGEVYQAKDSVLGRMVAIKRIRIDAIAEGKQLEEVKKRFILEAQVAAQLRHPNIVTTHDIVEAPDSSFIVMEMVEGQTLGSLIKSKGRLSLEETLDILSQAASALDHAHAHKVVHRDVKPANLMVEPNGQVKVMDFGIAKAETSGHITATGTILGTPFYMSPEQASGKAVDGRSDLFSLACIAYECLSGSRPFQGDQITAILLKIVGEDPPPIEHARLGLPETMDPILQRALAKNPDERFATGEELVAALRSNAAVEVVPETIATAATAAPTAATMGVSASPAESATIRASEVSTTSRSRLVPVAAVLFLLAVVGGWAMFGSEAPAPTVTETSAETTTEDAASATQDSTESTELVVVEEAGFLASLVGAEDKLRITVPAGTTIAATLGEAMSSETLQVGDTFALTATAPIIIEGHEAVAPGGVLEGHVSHVASAGKVSGTGELTLEFDRVVTPDGTSLLIDAEPFHQTAAATKAQDAKKIGGLAGIGGVVGGLFGGKKGALIGGAAGATAGAASTLTSAGNDVLLAAGTTLDVALRSPITVTIPRPAEP